MSWFENNYDFFYSEQQTCMKHFPGLHFQKDHGEIVLQGNLAFKASFNGYELISDEYLIKIFFDGSYPTTIPFTKEIGNRIPDNYHKLKGGFLCLGTYLEIYLIFSKQRNLFNYITNLLIPYLYNFSYFEKDGVVPLGERVHGYKGILQFYNEKYKITSKEILYNLLKYVLLNKKYSSNYLCPCGSGKKNKECHNNFLQELFSVPKEIINLELRTLI